MNDGHILSPLEQILEHHVDMIKRLPTLESIGYLRDIIEKRQLAMTDEQKKLECITEIERSIRNIDNMLLIIKKQNEEFDAKYDAMQKQNEEFADKQALIGYDWPRMPERIQEKPVLIESNSGSMIPKGSLPEATPFILLYSFLLIAAVFVVLFELGVIK